MNTPPRRLELYVLIESLTASLHNARSADGAVRAALRAGRDFLAAETACVAVLEPGAPEARVTFRLPAEGRMEAPLAEFILERHPAIPPTLVLAPVRRHGRPWGVLALARRSPFEKGDGQALCRIASVLTETIDRIERERIVEVRSRIDRKIMEELRPKDLFYQILDGLRSLTRYDHSSALLIRYPGERCLMLEAEQIAWEKGRSRRIGERLDLPRQILEILEEDEVYGFHRDGRRWTQWHGRPAVALAELLDSRRPPGGSEVPGPEHATIDAGHEASMLCATLSTRGGAFGVLKIASRYPGSLGAWDAQTLDGFRSQAAIAIQNSLRTESLQARMLEAERKHAMADLARGISHDVNNALGTAIPLVQKMRADLDAGLFDPGVFAEDLGQVIEDLQHCRRIFGGMLGFARRAAHGSASAEVERSARAAISLLKSSLDRRRIHTVIEIPENLPPVGGSQSDLERIFFNLLGNARDATPDGGRLSVRARSEGGGVEILIEDSGRGIPPEDLPRVQEPFFTTKEEGNGLGLSICRSLLWQMNGDLAIESEPGRGTRVRLRIPRAHADAEGGG
jgi:signal transduction histidine kinase